MEERYTKFEILVQHERMTGGEAWLAIEKALCNSKCTGKRCNIESMSSQTGTYEQLYPED